MGSITTGCYPGLPSTISQFAEELGYTGTRFASRDAFIHFFGSGWSPELQDAISDLLADHELTLSIGCGYGESEISLVLEGYRITGSDIVFDALAQSKRLFPEFQAIVFDVFAPPLKVAVHDVVLITGIAYYFQDDKLYTVLRNVHSLLKQDGRLIFTLRYRHNIATWLIDCVALPLFRHYKNIVGRNRGEDCIYVLELKGYRRSFGEVVSLARSAGFELGRVKHAGFGRELTRLDLHIRFKKLWKVLTRLDVFLRWFNSATVFEFIRV